MGHSWTFAPFHLIICDEDKNVVVRLLSSNGAFDDTGTIIRRCEGGVAVFGRAFVDGVKGQFGEERMGGSALAYLSSVGAHHVDPARFIVASIDDDVKSAFLGVSRCGGDDRADFSIDVGQFLPEARCCFRTRSASCLVRAAALPPALS